MAEGEHAPTDEDGEHLIRNVRYLVATGICDPSEFVIAGSALLYVMGAKRRLSDIDIVARGDTLRSLWALAAVWGSIRKGVHTGDEIAYLDHLRIEVSGRWVGPVADADRLIDEAELVDGLPFITLDDLVAYKNTLDRPKDRADLKALARFEGAEPPLSHGRAWIELPSQRRPRSARPRPDSPAPPLTPIAPAEELVLAA